MSTAVTTPSSLFAAEHVPDILWPNLLEVFGVLYDYHLADGTVVAGLRGILTEGTEGEPMSPGRYARFWVDLRDLPQAPQAADWIDLGGITYDVESVDSTLYEISQLIIKRSGQTWLTR